MAVMQYVVQTIALRVIPLLDSASEFLAGEHQLPNDCLRHLSRLIESSAMLHSSDKELMSLSNIIMREQARPTDAFDVLYDGILGRLHCVGEELMAAYVTGNPKTSGFSVRFHALLGQGLAFRVARSTAIRAAGWVDIGVSQEAEIKEVVLEYTALILNGLRNSYRHAQKPASLGSPAL
ncbi:CerR family C-terminal domain-containing protein [Undibacterium arcticum]